MLVALGALPACEASPSRPDALRAAGVPAPIETIDTAAAKIGRASADPSCRSLDTLIHSYLRPKNPSERRMECLRFLARLEGFDVLATAAYGTGGVIDSVAGAQGEKSEIALLLALDSDLRFKLFAIGAGDPGGTIGTTQPDPAAFDSAVAGAIDAIRRGDCAALYSLSHPTLAPGASDEATFCAQYQNNRFQEALRARPDSAPLRLGGNAFYGFYALNLGPDRYYTILLGRHGDRPLFGSEIRAQV